MVVKAKPLTCSDELPCVCVVLSASVPDVADQSDLLSNPSQGEGSVRAACSASSAASGGGAQASSDSADGAVAAVGVDDLARETTAPHPPRRARADARPRMWPHRRRP